MEKINCINCAKVQGDKFTTQYYCPVLDCYCKREDSFFTRGYEKFGSGPIPRLVPEVGEDKCPGMVAGPSIGGYNE